MRSTLALVAVLLAAFLFAACASQPFQQPGSGGATTYTFTPTIVVNGAGAADTKPTNGSADAHHQGSTTATGGTQTPTADLKPNVNIPAAGGAVVPGAGGPPPTPPESGATVSVAPQTCDPAHPENCGGVPLPK